MSCHHTAMSLWIAAAGGLLVSLDSMMNIAFPAIATAFAAPPERVRWVIVCYVLTYAITSFAGGAAADRLGHVVVFRTGVGLSVIAFVMGGTAAQVNLAVLLMRRQQILGLVMRSRPVQRVRTDCHDVEEDRRSQHQDVAGVERRT